MLVGAPFLGMMWVVPFGTVAATVVSPLALRFAPLKTPRALIRLAVSGALLGFGLLFLVGFGVSLYFRVTYPDTPLKDALLISQVYGPVFGALTAAGWWWQLPQPIREETSGTPAAA
jgi:hypothetical protein